MQKFPFSDVELTTAAKQVHEAILHSVSAEVCGQHVFSETFEQRMLVLIRSVKKKAHIKKSMYHAAAVILSFLIGTGVWLAFDIEARADLQRWVHQVVGNMASFIYSGDTTLNTVPLCELTWLPEGLSLLASDGDDQVQTQIYTDPDNPNATLMLTYYLTQEEISSSISITGSEIKVDLSGRTGYFYEGDLNSGKSNTLFWIDDDLGLTSCLSGLYDMATMMKIAESVEIVK